MSHNHDHYAGSGQSITPNIFFCLASAVESEAEPNPTQPSSAGSSSVAQRSSILPSISISRPTVGNAQVNEHRKLFGYKKGKQPKRGKSVVKQQRVQTCSLKFVCLASGSSSKPPTSVKERTMLANAGLGDSTILFDLDDSTSHCHEKILEAYPKLASTGYELLLFDRSADVQSFCHLKPPYLPKKLKEVAGQCKIYVRPLQSDIEVTVNNEEEEIQVH